MYSEDVHVHECFLVRNKIKTLPSKVELKFKKTSQ